MSSQENGVNILNYLCNESISTDLQSETKLDVLNELVSLLETSGNIEDKEKIFTSLQDREKLGSTGIGQEVAIPHGKSDYTKKIVAALGISKKGIDYESLDADPVRIFFVLIVPTQSSGIHLKILAKISRLLKEESFRKSLKEANSSEEVIHLLRNELKK